MDAPASPVAYTNIEFNSTVAWLFWELSLLTAVSKDEKNVGGAIQRETQAGGTFSTPFTGTSSLACLLLGVRRPRGNTIGCWRNIAFLSLTILGEGFELPANCQH
jgi:hypothetical protein